MADVSDSLQNLMLQHARFDTFLKHYLNRNITADILSIYRGLEPQKGIGEDDLPQRVKHLKKRCDFAARWLRGRMGQSTGERLGGTSNGERNITAGLKSTRGRIKDITRPVAGPRSEKQRARIQLKRDILERYRPEEPVVDSQRQVSGKVVDKDMENELVRSEYKTPEQMIVIDAVLTLPPRVPEGELQRQITAIHGVSVYYGAGEHPLCRRRGRGSSRKPITVKPTAVKAEVMGQP
ncbi:hypothetical protein PAAG_01561 [Paracoccidioides lutzii Pb01]|uniref:Uncharacterized protein n=1 Tax=Paracoccidioides lutzii (strain ATCC MYA-826 / Pb01) TaxID=502779 RepID=C1GSR6_PARBA|nr:hypothetical protein PAAG_01561 [Paracoccidioides lutzii Pb01]EEH39099.2 hypothetical protein PAAG_01561 [Paracoccidioides lutzii Pb01]